MNCMEVNGIDEFIEMFTEHICNRFGKCEPLLIFTVNYFVNIFRVNPGVFIMKTNFFSM